MTMKGDVCPVEANPASNMQEFGLRVENGFNMHGFDRIEIEHRGVGDFSSEACSGELVRGFAEESGEAELRRIVGGAEAAFFR
jgi:hypothetical protein